MSEVLSTMELGGPAMAGGVASGGGGATTPGAPGAPGAPGTSGAHGASGARRKLEIARFDPSTMPPDATVLAVGKRNTGKSTLEVDLIWNLRHHYDLVIGFNESEESSRTLAKFCPPAFTYKRFDATKLEEVIDFQRKMVEASETSGRRRFKRIALVLDDAMANPKTRKAGVLNDIHMVGRHRKVGLFNTVQYLYNVPRDLRAQMDFVFCFREVDMDNLSRIHKSYFNMFTFAEFKHIFDSNTQGFDCIVLDNRNASQSLEGRVFWYRADPTIKPFRSGAKVYWKLSKYFAHPKVTALDIDDELEKAARPKDRASGPDAPIEVVRRKEPASKPRKSRRA